MVLFNPSVTTCHLPYILHRKTQGRWIEIFRKQRSTVVLTLLSLGEYYPFTNISEERH